MMETAYHLDHAMLHSRNRGKCTRIHANLGRGVDGCQLFDGENPNDMHCGACGCHMEFHVKLNVGSQYDLLSEGVIDLDPGSKRYKRSPRANSPAESVGDNLDAPGLEANSGFNPDQDDFIRIFGCSKLDDKPASLPTAIRSERDDKINRSNYTRTPLYFKLCSKLKLIQEEYPEDIHGKFSIVYDDDYGYRVYCGGCDKRYGLVKPGFSLGNFERGHLACKRHKDLRGSDRRIKVQKSVKEFLQQAEAKNVLKTLHCR
ncbi:hypothetical protein M758_10G114300 [Ceratodon purpureus]|uniref:ZF-HD dimerization-type domain-containing protein n=1 Tax=Ceratodon purpureus TaxID=3225 RepID=A0A8T0GKT2_CERPU|nr:hypothetical protein KC19_10G117400 [Ceratodon purpureus]KAG0603699.1 hypothetical protein M758_10G114300 [Ceratodon purpureus]